MQRATVETADWWARPRGESSQQWIANYQRSLQTRHRTAIAQIVGELQPETVFEVGCHCGPNLVRLAQEFPALRMIGIDASAEAVVAGRSWVAQLGFGDRVQLNTQRFPADTERLATGSFDVVLSCYSLAYIAPGDLDAALYECGRLATRAVIIAEPMAVGTHRPPPVEYVSRYREWAHDYQDTLRWIGSLADVRTRVVPVEPPVDRLNAILVIERDDAR
jgi:cyclopropane fatty-acyl-phospholipid synthase-like methyltransferase